jgi:hypothetical protein
MINKLSKHFIKVCQMVLIIFGDHATKINPSMWHWKVCGNQKMKDMNFI